MRLEDVRADTERQVESLRHELAQLSLKTKVERELLSKHYSRHITSFRPAAWVLSWGSNMIKSMHLVTPYLTNYSKEMGFGYQLESAHSFILELSPNWTRHSWSERGRGDWEIWISEFPVIKIKLAISIWYHWPPLLASLNLFTTVLLVSLGNT